MVVSPVHSIRKGFDRNFEPPKKIVPRSTVGIFQQALEAEITKLLSEDDYKEKELGNKLTNSHGSSGTVYTT